LYQLGITLTRSLIGNDNLLTDYSFIRGLSWGLVARCVSGLGITSGDDNATLGIWYFNGAPLPYGLCESPLTHPIQSRIAGLMNFIGVINLWQCAYLVTPAAEGIYTCVMLDSSMMNQTRRLGVYFSTRSESIVPLLTIFHLFTQLLQ